MKAIIDIGTNTFHLLIAEISAQGFNEVFQKQIPVKIGAGGINKGMLTEDAYARGMNTLQEFADIIKQYPVESIVAAGTSAIRNASNGKEFIGEAKQRFGFNIECISGDEEAELIYKGVSMSFELPDEPILVMDIGGGSVEFILGKRNHIYWAQSFEIGAARLLERFNPSDPMTSEESYSIREYLKKMLHPLIAALEHIEKTEGKVKLLVGSAGCFESILDILKMDLGLSYDSLSPFAHVISFDNFEDYCSLILRSTVEQRKKLKGLVDFRVDMIVIATLLITLIQWECMLERFVASNYALKEGLILRKVNSN